MAHLRRALALAALVGPLALVSPTASGLPPAVAAATTEQQPGPTQAGATPAAPAPVAPATPAPEPVLSPRPGTSVLPSLRTKAWVLADLDSGEILAMYQPDERRRPASTLKLLTVMTVAPRLSPDQPYRAVAADESAEGNRVVLYSGLRYKVSDLIHAALMPSANDAADAIARANGGIDRTVSQMQDEAERLGATSTTVRNPSGLDADGQLTTARDMATIGRAALHDDEIAAYLQLTSVDFPGKKVGDGRYMYPIYSHNLMLTRGFPGTLGGKSGYTSGAGRTFVGAAEGNGHRLIVAMLGIGGNTYRTPERLLRWGLANYSRLTPVGSLPKPTGPEPTFDRSVRPLPPKGEIPSGELLSRNTSDAPTAPERPFRLVLPTIPWLPSPIGLLTIAFSFLALQRARILMREHRARTGWISLDVWSSTRDVPSPGPPAKAGGPDGVTSPPDTLGAPSGTERRVEADAQEEELVHARP